MGRITELDGRKAVKGDMNKNKDNNSIEERKNKLVGFMKHEKYRPMLLKEIAAVLEVPKEDLIELSGILEELEGEGRIFKTKNERYGVPENFNLMAGKLICKERGYGFVVPFAGSAQADGPVKPDALAPRDVKQGREKDIYIPPEAMNGAMHNDKVIARINVKDRRNARFEGEVLKILERANKTVIGTYTRDPRYGYGIVTPDDKRIAGEIFIRDADSGGATGNQAVEAEITVWPSKGKSATGRITAVLGNAGDPAVGILSIIKTHGLRDEFPEAVIEEAGRIPEVVTENMLGGRRDLRGLKMVTIDGEDAKDLDDAVSIEKLDNGRYRLGVHIADVSYYVTEGTALDHEASLRGTSVYLVDRVIPMLPPELSNGICSLNPHTDRLAFSVFMEIGPAGEILGHEIFESVININERMTYTDVYKLLKGGDDLLEERYSGLLADFKLMEELAAILKGKRFHRGAIDFEFEETKITLDKDNKPVEIGKYKITIANKIIEEFMLACNETVAEHFFWTETPFVYRIHEEPDMLKIQAFEEFVHNFGYRITEARKLHPRALQELLEKVKGTDEERIISTVMLRSLQKARYSEEHDGHFGLAAEYYSHFTSPIRRYPDLVIHRIMKEYLKNGISSEKQEQLAVSLKKIAAHCSERERAADEAERDTEDLKKAEFMKEHIGESFEGIIANVTQFGMYVELDNTIEGLVRLSSMEDDYYIFDEKNYSLTGERTGKSYKIGGHVKVKLIRADIMSRQIDFILISGKDDRRNVNRDSTSMGNNIAKARTIARAGKSNLKVASKAHGSGRKIDVKARYSDRKTTAKAHGSGRKITAKAHGSGKRATPKPQNV